MAIEWFLKSLDDEFGPIPFTDLVELARDGTVVESDLLRPAQSTKYQRAESIIGLFYMARRPAEKSTEPKTTATIETAASTVPDPIVDGKASELNGAVDNRPEWLIRLLEARDGQLTGGLNHLSSRSGNASSAPLEEIEVNDEPEVPEPVSDPFQELLDNFEEPAASSSTVDSKFGSSFDRGPSDWSRTVDEALEMSERSPCSNAVPQTPPKPGLFNRIGQWHKRLLQLVQKLGGWYRIGEVTYRVSCGLLCAYVAWYGISSWSKWEALRYPMSQPADVHQFPLIGACSLSEYMFWSFDTIAVAGCLGFWGASILAAKAED